MCGLLDCYLDKLAKLDTEKNEGFWPQQTFNRDPHEPLLLLVVISLIDSGEITRNFIEPSQTLADCFNQLWEQVMDSGSAGNLTLPFCSLAATGFWHLRPRPGSSLKRDKDIDSLIQLREKYFGAILDADLFPLLIMKSSREKIKAALVKNYFPPAIRSILTIQVN
jgi:putative restriction endonuclease